LFGLDVLKRHQAIIDLKANCLIINGESIPFLAEHELPENAQATFGGKSTTGKESSEQAASSSEGKQTSSKYPEPVIRVLTDMGASREEAIAALDACNGSADMAANILF
jgi:DNA damage-inducible protein 1